MHIFSNVFSMAKKGRKKAKKPNGVATEEVGKDSAVVRTVVVPSARLSYKTYFALAEVEHEYRRMLEELVGFAHANGVTSYVRLLSLKYREMRQKYPDLPSMYAVTACRDAAARVKSFLAKKRRGEAHTDRPQVRNVSIWLHAQLWKPEGRKAVRVATKRGWITIELRPHKHFWKYVNGGWALRSEARLRLDHRRRIAYFHFVFEKVVKPYEPRGYLPVDVNENNVTVLVDGAAYLLETDVRRITLSYAERRKRVQERHSAGLIDKRQMERATRKLRREGKKKKDIRRKIANIVVQLARQRGYAIVLERLGRNPGKNMIKGVKDPELRHRIYQAAFRGVQRAIEEKAREFGVPIIYVDPKNTSKLCPIHGVKIKYSKKTRRGRCPVGGEVWHRDVVAVWNLLLRARGDVGSALSPGPSGRGDVRVTANGGLVAPAPTAAHDPVRISRSVWARRKPPALLG